MRFGSVCSGIEAASVAFTPLGWEPAWFSEIEPFPCAVLKHHYPSVPNLGDMTTLPQRILSGEVEAPEILCGGTPCQAFSVAGKRMSLDDYRGNLTLCFCDIGDAIDSARFVRGGAASVIFWENVTGVLNTRDNAFGCFLAKLIGAEFPLRPSDRDYKWSSAGFCIGKKRKAAWRVLDAKYFGVPQRRRRVYVVASARKDFDPTKVLFERACVPRDSEQSRETGEDVACFTETGFVSFHSDTRTTGAITAHSSGYKGGMPIITSRFANGGGVASTLTASDLVKQVNNQCVNNLILCK